MCLLVFFMLLCPQEMLQNHPMEIEGLKVQI